MIATLPMYDRPETAAANDRFYSLFRRHFPAASETLLRDEPHWLDRDLLLSQTCSLPYRAVLHTDVHIVATPIHTIACDPGLYFSVIVVRNGDPRAAFTDYSEARLAINSRLSQSGWAAIDQMAGEEGFVFNAVTETGSHQASAKAVAEGRADIAALDAVTWEMIKRWDPFAKELRILAETPASPALPFITSLTNDVETIQSALIDAVEDLSQDDKDLLCLDGIAFVSPDHYLAMPIPPAPPCVLAEIE